MLLAQPADASRELPGSLSPTLDGPVSGPADIRLNLPIRPRLPFFTAADIATLAAATIYDYDDSSSPYCIYDGPGGLFFSTRGVGYDHRYVGLSFQGLWTDPVTGIAYARNRWYDARTASWLSEDPMGAVDSPNLYAFVGWGPHRARDPMGLCQGNPQFCRFLWWTKSAWVPGTELRSCEA